MSERASKDQLAQFLSVLWPGGFGEHWCLFWGAPSKASQWTQTMTDDFLSTLLLWGARENVYIGCGLRAQNFGPTLRGDRADVVAIPGVWLDVDYGKEHKKPNLPPDEDAARALLAEMGPAPTMLLHSGRGLQAWWVFREPWIFENDADRAKAERLTKGWCNTLRAKAKAHGWDADQVGDLPRVMRLPGLWNLKGAKKPTVLLDAAGLTFEPSDLDALLFDLPQDPEHVPNLAWTFTMDPNAEPPAEKFRLLWEYDPLFVRSWNHTRTEFQDQSANVYDLSLATRAMQAGWTAQEIVNLCLAHRRKHGDDPKLRKDYYERTLNKAAAKKPEEDRKQRIEDLKAGKPIPESVALDPAEALATVSSTLGVSVTKFVRFRSDGNHYQLTVNGRLIHAATVEDFGSQARFRNMLLDHTNIYLDFFKPAKWKEVMGLLFNAIEEINVVGGSHQMTYENWIDLHLSGGIAVESQWQEAAEGFHPFRLKGGIWISTEGFRKFLILHMHEKITARALVMELTKLGHEFERKYFKTQAGEKTSRGVWRLIGMSS